MDFHAVTQKGKAIAAEHCNFADLLKTAFYYIDMTDFFRKTLAAVEAAIALHENEEPAPFSIHFLMNTKNELEKMISIMDPRIYKPTYPRFVIDWSESSTLAEHLLEASYYYGKIKKRVSSFEN